MMYTCKDALEIMGDAIEEVAAWEAFEADMAEGDPWATGEEPDFADMARW